MIEPDHTDHVRTAMQCLDVPAVLVRNDGTSPEGDRMIQEGLTHAMLAVAQQLRVANLIELRKEFIREDDYRRASALLNLEIRPLLGLNR